MKSYDLQQLILQNVVLSAHPIQSSFICISYPNPFHRHIVSKVVLFGYIIVSKVVLSVCFRIQSSFIGVFSYPKQFYRHTVSKVILSAYRIQSFFFTVCHRIESSFIGMLSYRKQFYGYVNVSNVVVFRYVIVSKVVL